MYIHLSSTVLINIVTVVYIGVSPSLRMIFYYFNWLMGLLCTVLCRLIGFNPRSIPFYKLIVGLGTKRMRGGDVEINFIKITVLYK